MPAGRPRYDLFVLFHRTMQTVTLYVIDAIVAGYSKIRMRIQPTPVLVLSGRYEER